MNARDLVGDRYVDALGTERFVPATTREAFINVLRAGETASIAPAVRVLREAEPLTIDVTLPAASWDQHLLWTLRSERDVIKAEAIPLRDAPVVRFAQRDGVTYDTRRVALRAVLPVGDYRLTLDVGTYGHAGVAVVVGNERAYLPPDDAPIWGLAVQVYTLRSATNWGIGDFGDLRAVCALAASAGARLVGINPIHASHRNDPESASPYAPTSRRFLNWLPIEIGAVPESRRGAAAAYIATLHERLAELRETPNVDYASVAAVKADALRMCFEQLAGKRAADFRSFVRAGGERLRRFAIYEVLVERFGRNIFAWPVDFQEPAAPGIELFADANDADVRYAMYLQWCAAEQFADVSEFAAQRGVTIYRDLAVGVEANSADVWSDAGYVRAATVGAPPDILNTRGQDWGLPPIAPAALQDGGFATFAGLLADNMRNAGALRIDHAMSLMRLFWIPRGAPASAGAYVGYPFDDLLAVLARESLRAKCMVIGEDLGTVPEGFRERMTAANVLSYRLLLFERDADGTYIPPERYPVLALAAIGTHDLPPLGGWLRGDDIDVRERLGMLDLDTAAADRIQRRRDIVQLRAALDARDADDEDLPIEAYRFLARTPARIVMLQIEDAIGEISSVNIPGTDREYPNWRRKLRLDLATIAGGPRFERFAAVLRELRPRA